MDASLRVHPHQMTSDKVISQVDGREFHCRHADVFYRRYLRDCRGGWSLARAKKVRSLSLEHRSQLS